VNSGLLALQEVWHRWGVHVYEWLNGTKSWGVCNKQVCHSQGVAEQQRNQNIFVIRLFSAAETA
jgi:hypothetical protein